MQLTKFSFVLAAAAATAVAGSAAAAPIFSLDSNGSFGSLDGLATDTAVVDGFTGTLSNPIGSDGTPGTLGNDNRGAGVNSNNGNFDNGESFQLSFDQDVYLVAITNQAVDNNAFDTDDDGQNDLFVLDTVQLSFGGTDFLFGDADDVPGAVAYDSFGSGNTARGVFPTNTLVPANTPITISNVTGGGSFRVQSIEIAPVPEPTTLSALVGLAGLGLRRRR